MTLQSDKSDIQPDFFETLAGNQSGHPNAEVLREALQSQARTIKQAENALPEKLPDYEQAKIDALKKQLIKTGVFKQSPPGEALLLEKFLNLFKFNFTNPNWGAGFTVGVGVGAGFAVAASVVLLSFIALQQPDASLNDPNSNSMAIAKSDAQDNENTQEYRVSISDMLGHNKPSGAQDNKNSKLALFEKDPQQVATNLRDRVIAAGGKAEVVQASDKKWSLVISIPDKSKELAVKNEILMAINNKNNINNRENKDLEVTIIKTLPKKGEKNEKIEHSSKDSLLNKIFNNN